jgi:hypothetical protein
VGLPRQGVEIFEMKFTVHLSVCNLKVLVEWCMTLRITGFLDKVQEPVILSESFTVLQSSAFFPLVVYITVSSRLMKEVETTHKSYIEIVIACGSFSST